MAHKKAKYFHYQKKCTKEAKRIVHSWFIENGLAISFKSIYVVWFAFTQNGYRCMITSKMYPNNFFEITKNMINDETICNVFQQIAYIVNPSNTSPVKIDNSSNEYLFDLFN